MSEDTTVEQALHMVDTAALMLPYSWTKAVRVLAAEVRALRADIDLPPEELEQALAIAREMDDAPVVQLRQSGSEVW